MSDLHEWRKGSVEVIHPHKNTFRLFNDEIYTFKSQTKAMYTVRLFSTNSVLVLNFCLKVLHPECTQDRLPLHCQYKWSPLILMRKIHAVLLMGDDLVTKRQIETHVIGRHLAIGRKIHLSLLAFS